MHFIRNYFPALDKHVHIVSFTVPYPVIHGGMSDLYYKLVALYNAGIKIHLHCFTNGPAEPALEKYCTTVNYYERKQGLPGFSFSLPYIVSSRHSRKLRQLLLQDNYPILLEGIHSTHILGDEAFASRKIVLRLHNIEYKYYHHLYIHSSSFFKKIYYLHESRLLKKYESRVANKPSWIMAVSENDKDTYQRLFGVKNIEFLPVFTGYDKVDSETGTGCFCLYHGNLSVAENERAAMWLLREVFEHLDIPLVIAGRNPSAKLAKEIKRANNASLVANPLPGEMQDLIKKAQCHALPSLNSTGVKLKLINALYNGRHCIVNEAGAAGSGMEKLCHMANSAQAFRDTVNALFVRPFLPADIVSRSEVLNQLYNAEKNAGSLIRKLW